MRNWRETLKKFVDHPKFQAVIIALIVINGAILGAETSKSVMNSEFGPWLERADAFCLWVFVAELLLVAIAHGPRFLRDPWRIFDTIVIGIALAPAGGGLSVLRGLRVLRVLRLINNAPSLKRIINAMVATIPGMGSICALLGIFYYVSAVMTTKLFGEAFPEWFGSLGASFYTLFQVMTLESWSMGIVRPVMEQFPYAWAFFVPFIAIATFTMLNLFVGVIVGAMQAATEGSNASPAESPNESVKAPDIGVQLETLSRQVADVQRLLGNSDQPHLRRVNQV